MIKVIGIDPDLKKCGIVAMTEKSIEIDDFKIYTTAMLIEDIPEFIGKGFVFAVEDVNKISTIYSKNRKGGAAVQSRIAQNVGMVKAAAKIIQDYIEHCGGVVIPVPVGVGKQTKKNAKLFKELTGYTGSTNEDIRDAYWIAKHAFNNLTAITANK